MVGRLQILVLQNTGVDGKQTTEFLEKLLGVADTEKVKKNERAKQGSSLEK